MTLAHDSYQHNLFIYDRVLYAVMKFNVYLMKQRESDGVFLHKDILNVVQWNITAGD